MRKRMRICVARLRSGNECTAFAIVSTGKLGDHALSMIASAPLATTRGTCTFAYHQIDKRKSISRFIANTSRHHGRRACHYGRSVVLSVSYLSVWLEQEQIFQHRPPLGGIRTH